MNKHALKAAVAAVALVVAGAASASTTDDVTVDAYSNSFVDGPSGGADANFVLTAGENFTIWVDPTQLWQNDPDVAYLANADGNTFQGLQAMDNSGFTARIGSLVGQIGNGSLFLVGTSFTGQANANGDLKLFYWDSDYANNSGSVVAHISAVPEPSSLALMAFGLVAVGLSRRRKI